MVTGSIPTENLPTKSHGQPTKERRTLVRLSIDDKPSVSTSDVPTLTLKDPVKYVIEKHILPWMVKLNNEYKVRIRHNEYKVRIRQQVTQHVNANLEFTVYVYN